MHSITIIIIIIKIRLSVTFKSVDENVTPRQTEMSLDKPDCQRRLWIVLLHDPNTNVKKITIYYDKTQHANFAVSPFFKLHTHTDPYTHTHTHTHARARARTRMHARTHARKQARTYAHTHARTHILKQQLTR